MSKITVHTHDPDPDPSSGGEADAIDTFAMSPAMIADAIARLSPRQLEITGHIARGMSDKKTALLLSISPRTVRSRLLAARQRVGVDNRIQLIAVFVAWKYQTAHE